MKNVAIGEKAICCLFVLLLVLPASACIADQSAAEQYRSSGDTPYNIDTVDVFLSTEDELLDFIASTDEKYPMEDEKLNGSIADLLQFIRQNGYIWMMRDSERHLQPEAWRIHGDPQSGRQSISYCLATAERRITVTQYYPNAALFGKELSTWMEENPDWPTPASWENNDPLTSCQYAEYTINDEKTEAIIARGMIEKKYPLYEIRAMVDGMLFCFGAFEEYDSETVSQFVWEKVPLPDAAEATSEEGGGVAPYMVYFDYPHGLEELRECADKNDEEIMEKYLIDADLMAAGVYNMSRAMEIIDLVESVFLPQSVDGENYRIIVYPEEKRIQAYLYDELCLNKVTVLVAPQKEDGSSVLAFEGTNLLQVSKTKEASVGLFDYGSESCAAFINVGTTDIIVKVGSNVEPNSLKEVLERMTFSRGEETIALGETLSLREATAEEKEQSRTDHVLPD